MKKVVSVMSIINKIILGLGIILYFILTFQLDVDLATGHKELENIILIALPCFIILFSSFMIKDETKRKKYLILYLISFIVVMIGFILSNNRSNILVNENIMFRENNLVLFYSIINLFSSDFGIGFALYNIVGNLLMLTPLAVLLPMIFNSEKDIKKFSLTIIVLCIGIELIQYLTKLGSFDIDDIILNFSGAVILFLIIQKTKLKNIIEDLFNKKTFNEIVCFIVWLLLIIVFILTSVSRFLLIRQNYLNNKVNMKNVKCIETNKKLDLGDVGNYHYYSKCNYANSYIMVGKQRYIVEDFIKSPYFSDKYIKPLKLERKEIVTNVILKEKKDNLLVLYTDETSTIYLHGYKEFLIEKDGTKYDVVKSFKNEKLDISFIHSLVELNYLDNKNNYAIETGKYYNILTCSSKYSEYSNFYILNPNYKIDKNTCSKLQKLK